MESSPRAEMPKQDELRTLIHQSTTQLVQQANDGLRRLSDTVQNKSLSEIVSDAESFARSQPAVFLGAAAFAGFLAVRFLKSSSQRGRSPRDYNDFSRS